MGEIMEIGSGDVARVNAADIIPVADSPVLLRREIVEAYESALATVPDAGGDGFESILAALLLATDVMDLDAPWRSAGFGELVNVPLVITGIRKMPSDYPGGLPWFLIADGAIVETGETVSITTGAVSIVAQLTKAHQLGGFPLRVIPRQAERPSKSGYYPQHLELVR
jgi:hypothetical protein